LLFAIIIQRHRTDIKELTITIFFVSTGNTGNAHTYLQYTLPSRNRRAAEDVCTIKEQLFLAVSTGNARTRLAQNLNANALDALV
jgi:hypothetical protein